MTPKQIVEMLTDEDVINILSDLTSQHPKKHKTGLIFLTDICHGGDSFKLYYYSESKRFKCFSGCGKSYSIFDLVKSESKYKQFTAFEEVVNSADHEQKLYTSIDLVVNSPSSTVTVEWEAFSLSDNLRVPITQAPVVSKTAWYTSVFSPDTSILTSLK